MSIKWPARAEGQTPDITGRPDEPWWTRQAIIWMDKYLTRNMSLVEWGAGASTLWLAARCGRFVSIESNPKYMKMVSAALDEAGMDQRKYRVVLQPLGPDYYESVRGKYDAAIVDGRLRVECCARAMKLLVPGGVLLLDNAERPRYKKAVAMLASWPVVETNNGMWQTNIWIKPDA